MAQEFDEPPFDDDEAASNGRFSRRSGFDLTSNGVRMAATIVVIGLGILIIYFALRPREDEVAVLPPTPESTVEVSEGEQALATFTPGPTSTPPPQDVQPTEAGTPAEPGTPAGPLTIGAAATVTGTNGLGVNLRQESNTVAPILLILNDGASLTITEGPTENEGFTWWRVRLEDGTEGWVVQEYLSP